MTRKTAPARRMVGLTEAADHFGVCTKTLRRRIADGTLKAYRLGGKAIRVDLNEAEAALLRPMAAAGDR
ncbi:helix-turn-helix domain-containing protein [Rhodococcus sp. B50]|uniref:helix-turn-helix domain-containing protein n=1 Tax=Rhodococcus sp. B50 TaxID=2682847 RepID=UPI001A077BD3|nr:helix-turn-helix domain-containing protein [Rhodococcus sp. B50]MBS9373621.1 hypothetical protein [Rhodococcus sp. B50]